LSSQTLLETLHEFVVHVLVKHEFTFVHVLLEQVFCVAHPSSFLRVLVVHVLSEPQPHLFVIPQFELFEPVQLLSVPEQELFVLQLFAVLQVFVIEQVFGPEELVEQLFVVIQELVLQT
jgi:hypothetical protein